MHITSIFIAYTKMKVLVGRFRVTKVSLKVEIHYGNEDLKTIIKDLVSKKLLDFKFSNGGYDKPYYGMDVTTTDTYKERSKL